MISNHRDHLRLLRSRVIGEGKAMRTTTEEHDILGFDVAKDGRVRPLTILGWPDPLDGWTCAIHNARDPNSQTWTTLDGTVYSKYSDFLAPIYEEAERAAGRIGLAAGAPGPQRASQHAGTISATRVSPGGIGAPTPGDSTGVIGGETEDAESPGANWDRPRLERNDPKPWKSTER